MARPAKEKAGRLAKGARPRISVRRYLTVKATVALWLTPPEVPVRVMFVVVDLCPLPPHPAMAKTNNIAPASPILLRSRRIANAIPNRTSPMPASTTCRLDGGGTCIGAEGTKAIDVTVIASLIGFIPSGVTEADMGAQVVLAGAPVQAIITA